jgi:hypothetical protein
MLSRSRCAKPFEYIQKKMGGKYLTSIITYNREPFGHIYGL